MYFLVHFLTMLFLFYIGIQPVFPASFLAIIETGNKTMEKEFDELTIADDIVKQCTSCTLLNYKFSYRKLVTA